ncbi:MAG: universal stress protein [Acidimicrobiales bacterium]
MRYKIAVGFDGSLDAEAALRWAFDLALRTDADVAVVHAAGLLEHSAPRFPRDKTPEQVLDLADSCGVDPLRVHWHFDDGDPCSVLLRASDEPMNANLLVVGSRGHGRHPGLLLGSTSLELAEHATVPIVIVPSTRLHQSPEPSPHSQ